MEQGYEYLVDLGIQDSGYRGKPVRGGVRNLRLPLAKGKREPHSPQRPPYHPDPQHGLDCAIQEERLENEIKTIPHKSGRCDTRYHRELGDNLEQRRVSCTPEADQDRVRAHSRQRQQWIDRKEPQILREIRVMEI